ncbi:6-phospho-beta-glucosidase [Escherichia coli]|nr:6-phospho-beta-glucosidase [Escherichia coli]CAK0728704.1 6-phospho-beta-glucosidase [Escherichia coli]
MNKKLKIVTIGGGSSYTPEIIEGFIQRYHELPIGEIWLVDVEAGNEKLSIVGELAKRMVEAAGIDCQVHLTLDRREALKDADFVTTQLRVGQLDARIKDERIPLSHGLIGQETNGAGGLAKALRTIPVILDICRDMEELCPEAWLINFTNPSGMVTEAVLKHSRIKCVGLCNLSQSMQRMVAEILGVDKSRFLLHLTGLNHFLYGTHVYMDGKDVMPEVLHKLRYDSAHKPKNIPDIPWLQEQIQHLGVIPCPYHQYYYTTSDVLEKQLQEYAEHGTRGEVVKAVEHELFELYKNPQLHDKPKQL